MTPSNIANLRLISQQILKSKFDAAKDLVAWMGAMQAQDFNMAKWAIGLRLNKAREKDIDAAINSGEIIRTHVLRPTWHFVAADDIYWMVELTASRIKSSMKGRNKQLELTDKIFKKSFAIIEKVLKDEDHLTRKELVSELNKAKIVTNENRSSHILFHAELEGIICSGNMKGKQTTYALLQERIPKPRPLKKEEALFKLAKKYFESHCPATLPDFIWWSGLSVTDAKLALSLIKDEFISEKRDAQEYWFPRSFSIPKKFKESIFLLPAFDEFLISYKDRSAAIVLEHQKKAFSNNGIFWPVIVANGRAMGIWKREINKNKLLIEATLFDKTNETVKELLKKPLKKLEYFSGHGAEVFLK